MELPPTGTYVNAPLLVVHGNVVLMFAQANVDVSGGSERVRNSIDLCTQLLDSNAETEEDRKRLLNLQNRLQLSEDEVVQQQWEAQQKLARAEKKALASDVLQTTFPLLTAEDRRWHNEALQSIIDVTDDDP